jgi:uncharacterized protein (TIGR03083 family)
MTDEGHADDLAGPYVVEACPQEARSVADHASNCPRCAAEIAELSQVVEWIGASTAKAPPPGLRSRVLSAALATRPASHARDAPEGRRLGSVYRIQVAELDQLLSGLPQPHWQLAAGPHRSIHDLVAHLRGNDQLVAIAAGLDIGTSTLDIRLNWHRQALAIADVVARDGSPLLDRPVRLAGRRAVQRPLREAMIQRSFETWIHAEDVRATLDLPPQTPSAQQVADIVDFALRLLPTALEASGRAHPAKALRVVLTGDGGGIRLVELSPTGRRAGTVVAEIRMPAERFCRLLAGRLGASSPGAEISGERGAANDFLTVAATMGCD